MRAYTLVAVHGPARILHGQFVAILVEDRAAFRWFAYNGTWH